MKPLTLHPDRLFPAEAQTRAIARRLYARVAELPIISPHGHTDPNGSPAMRRLPIRQTC